MILSYKIFQWTVNEQENHFKDEVCVFANILKYLCTLSIESLKKVFINSLEYPPAVPSYPANVQRYWARRDIYKVVLYAFIKNELN